MRTVTINIDQAEIEHILLLLEPHERFMVLDGPEQLLCLQLPKQNSSEEERQIVFRRRPLK